MPQVYMIATTACIRVVKESLLLQAAGHDVRVLCQKLANADLAPYLDGMEFWQNDTDLQARLSRPEAALLHVHVEPQGLAAKVSRLRPDLPLVLDVHDADWGRTGTPSEGEVADLLAADAVVMPSVGYEREMRAHWDAWIAAEEIVAPPVTLPAPWTTVIRPLVPAGLLPGERLHPRIGGICYEGGVATACPYRDFRRLFGRMTAAGFPVHAYAPRGDVAKFADLGVIFMVQPYRRMLQELGRYDWGLVAPACGEHMQYRDASPNKLYEYLAAGLPAISWCCDEAERVIEESGAGYYATSEDDGLAYLVEHRVPPDEMRARARQWSREHTMETQTETLIEAYRRAVETAGARTGVETQA